MKILNAKSIREWDQFTIDNLPIASIDLMEKAAFTITDWISNNHFSEKFSFAVFCGTGNNGGDGLAITRQLTNKGYNAHAYLMDSDRAQYSTDCHHNRLRLTDNLSIISTANDLPHLSPNTIIIDALLGIGINKKLEGIYKETVEFINQQNLIVISVDLPSGVYLDTHTPKENTVVEADYTLTFQTPKLAMLLPENAMYIGDFEILDIGLHEDFESDSIYNYTTYKNILPLLKERKKFSHKGTYGHSLLIAGSLGKMGAAQLCTAACLRSGSGLVSVHSPKHGLPILQTNIPEAMVSVDQNEEHFTIVPELEPYTAIGVGPGLGRYNSSALALEDLIINASVPLVIDADAINLLAENQHILQRVPENSIYTPHVKEFERLVGTCSTSFERLEKAKEFAEYYKVFMILKGAHTAVISPKGKIFFNSTGNAGMATAGSGDVLTGIITSLLAQGYSSFTASILGVYIHGYAGDMAAKELGEESLIASDIIKNLSTFFKKV